MNKNKGFQVDKPNESRSSLLSIKEEFNVLKFNMKSSSNVRQALFLDNFLSNFIQFKLSWASNHFGFCSKTLCRNFSIYYYEPTSFVQRRFLQKAHLVLLDIFKEKKDVVWNRKTFTKGFLMLTKQFDKLVELEKQIWKFK